MQNSDRYDINLMCECLNVSRAGFYRFFYAGDSGRKERIPGSLSCSMEKAYR